MFMDIFSPFFFLFFFFFNDTATTEIYTLSLHDALPICGTGRVPGPFGRCGYRFCRPRRSEEHTSELQSLRHLVCRLLLEKKKKSIYVPASLLKSIRLLLVRKRGPKRNHARTQSQLSAQGPPVSFFFFNDTATTEIYTLSLHDALPI